MITATFLPSILFFHINEKKKNLYDNSEKNKVSEIRSCVFINHSKKHLLKENFACRLESLKMNSVEQNGVSFDKSIKFIPNHELVYKSEVSYICFQLLL